MSYLNTTIVLYGVYLDDKKTKLLQEYLINLSDVKDEEDFPDNIFERLVSENDLSVIECKKDNPDYIDGIEAPVYSDILRYNRPRRYHYVNVLSSNTDSRIHDLNFDIGETNAHYFGIYCGSRGYAHMDKIEEISSKIPQAAKNNFKKYCKPILKDLNINEKPNTHLVNQVW